MGYFRELASQRPDVYLSSVAMTLDNLGNVLNDLRRPEESLASYREALDIRRALAKQ